MKLKDNSWTKYYSLHDHLGNVRSLLKKYGSSYVIDQQYDYDAWGGILWQNEAKNERTKYIGKETDNESGDHNHGVRQYSDYVGRFLCPDGLWTKYYGWTPYQYAGNNPVSMFDRNGKDYDVKIDDKSKSITISQTIYTNSDSYETAKAGADLIMSNSGKNSYSIDGITYQINININVIQVDNPNLNLNMDIDGKDDDFNDKEKSTQSNSLILVDGSKLEKGAGGDASKNQIQIAKSSKDNPEVAAHEIMHTLGAFHSAAGLMTPSLKDTYHSNKIFPGQFKKMIYNARNGISPEDSKGYKAGVGTLKK
jgi:RHS repeat-associated protein